MNSFDAALRRYRRQVRSYLPCSGKQKRRILGDIQERISAFVEEHPDCTFTEVEAHFGSPQTIAAACLESMDLKELLHTIRLRRRIITVIIIVAFITVTLWAWYVTAAYEEHIVDTDGYYAVEIE